MTKPLIVHVAMSPLAGSPIRIVNATNTGTPFAARLINIAPLAYKTRTFQEDLIWEQDREEAESLIRSADILHFHHFFDFSSPCNPFRFDFIGAMKPGARHLMHWHSTPMTVARMAGRQAEELVKADLPQLVVAQFHESYYPLARPVPLIVEVESLSPRHSQRDVPQYFFSPSLPHHAYVDRWETKGRPQVETLLDHLQAEGVLTYKLIDNLPFTECMRQRLASDVVIDDLVTGGFHTTSLEGLAAGKPTLCHVDSRSQLVLAELTGSTDLPLVNVRYTEAEAVVRELSRDRGLREELGALSRDWMLRYYSEAAMIGHYVRAYTELLEGRRLDNVRYTTHRRAKEWLYTRVPDLLWQTRKQREETPAQRWKNLTIQLPQLARSLRARLGRWRRARTR